MKTQEPTVIIGVLFIAIGIVIAAGILWGIF